MIVLFNLNNYVGGGETLLIRLAQYLHINGYPYQILTADGKCWIREEATKRGLNCSVWPANIDSINYQDSAWRHKTLDALNSMYGHIKEIRIFTFCMRDLHNAMYFFTRMPNVKVWFSHGIYHPEDVFYLASFNFSSTRIIEFNRNLVRKLFDSDSILFVNENGLKISLNSVGADDVRSAIYAPLPINICGEIPFRKPDATRPFRIICISRFVRFKVAAVLAIMRYAANRSGIELLVIGHGPWKFILDAWIKIMRVDNIVIITGVSPDRLDSYIDTCDLGYAQGTSILEISKRGLPVLIAPYSRIRDIFNKNFPTLGIFGDIKDFTAFGDITDLQGVSTYKISDCIELVREDYCRYQEQAIEFVKTFASENVCRKIIDFILAAKLSNNQIEFNPPRAPLVKRILKFPFRFRG
jgi:hypothetical protein